MHTFPLPFDRYRALVQQGATLVVPRTRHVPAASVDRRVKQRSRLHWWLAETEARRLQAGAQALLLDESGSLTETAAANFLIVRGGAVISPPREAILEGVSLGVVRDLCARLAIPFRHEPIRVYDAVNADEALLTGTSFCLAGVRRLEHATLPCPGPVIGRLLAAWNAEVGLDIHKQILGA
jgi:branched-subunit amino acid aminotransferase/4-amino-4-deoxychorismate lyase